MFKLFQTFKDSSKTMNLQGIGLGLAISKMIVEKFNGQITFESELGKGSSFSFTFEMKKVRVDKKLRTDSVELEMQQIHSAQPISALPKQNQLLNQIDFLS